MSSLLDIYDEQFNRYLVLSKSLVSKLKSNEDREICKKWIKKLIALKTREVSVKRNRNAFFKYLLTVLQDGVLEVHDLPQYDDMYSKPMLRKKGRQPAFMSRWSKDRRTYIAAQPMPGRGALVYMAVAKDPSLGWDHPAKDNLRNEAN